MLHHLILKKGLFYLDDAFYCIRVISIKDLGVTFDSKLTFNEHITHVVRKANWLRKEGFAQIFDKYIIN